MNITKKQMLATIKKTKIVKDVDELEFDIPLGSQNIDSLDISNLLFNIEDEYDVEIPDEEIDKLQTIDQILNYINIKLS